MQSVSLATALPETVLSRKVWRISLKPEVAATDASLVIMKEPAEIQASVREIQMDEAVADIGSDIAIIWSSSGGSKADLDLESQITRDALPQQIVRAGLRTIRVIWCNSRAIIYSSAEHQAEALDAVIRFSVCAQKVDLLEKQLAAMWPTIAGFKNLTHSVKSADQRRQAAVNAATEQSTEMNIDAIRIYTALEQTDTTLSSTSKRLFAELTLQANLYDRLEVMEDPLEFFDDHLELANSRLIDAKAGRDSLVLEALILAVLIVNLLIFLR